MDNTRRFKNILIENLRVKVLLIVFILTTILFSITIFLDYNFISYIYLILWPFILFYILGPLYIFIILLFAAFKKSIPFLNKIKPYVLGITLSIILIHFIKQWDNSKRDSAGLILQDEIEQFYKQNNKYPDNPDELMVYINNDDLPYFYKLNRFFFEKDDSFNSYKLYLIRYGKVPHEWDEENQEFMYGTKK